MKIEVGEYGRTNMGKIFVFVYVENANCILIKTRNEHHKNSILNFDKYYLHQNDEILKHSKDILDLIEVGDILQVEISEEWVVKEDTIRFIVVGQTYEIQEIKEALENGIYKIRKILTHEQFEQNCYRLEE